MKKIVILSNDHEYTYNFRKEIIEKLIEQNYKVYIVLPYGEKVHSLKQMGCSFIDLPLDRRGKNPLTDLKLLLNYKKIIKKIKPNIVLSYTLKPNIYGALVCRNLKVPFIANVTGLGSAVENRGLVQRFIISLYKIAFKRVNSIFFQNKENQNFFKKEKIGRNSNFRLIPGSGVNINKYSLLDYPSSESIEFVYISRIMKEKGIDQYLKLAEFIKSTYSNTKFHVIGFCEEKEYESKLKEMHQEGVIEYHGKQSNIQKYLQSAHCTVHPTYYPEGISNVLLESAASGRPIITTDRSGCREVVEHEKNGYLVNQKSLEDLKVKAKNFLELNHNEKKNMGIEGRKKIIKEFNRDIVVNAYLEEVEKHS